MTEHSSASSGEETEQPGASDLISGLITIVFGAAVLIYISGFPAMPGGQPGPALFPGIIGGMMVGLGALLAGKWYLQWRKRPTREEPGNDPDLHHVTYGAGWINAASILGSIVFYILAVELLGFILTLSLVMFLLMWRLGAKRWVAAVAGVGATLVIWLIFQRGLQVPLPLGLWG